MRSSSHDAAVLEIAEVSKAYGGLRPLRLEQLTVRSAERVALVGLDQPMAEVFVNLVTGASLPDRGSVRTFGQATSEIADSSAWLALVDRFGIVSDRGVMLEGMTVLQNLALCFTLDIEPPAGEARARAVALAEEVGLAAADWERPVAALDGGGRASVRLARAVAIDPALLLLEHPTATVDRHQVAALGERARSVAEGRGAAIVALTMDQTFAEALGARILTLEPATGRLRERRGWFSRRPRGKS